MKLFNEPETVQHYRRLRAVGHDLVPKILDAAKPPRFDLVKAAKKLTIPVNGSTFVFDDGETEMAALMDFFMHEFRAGGRRPIDCLDPDVAGLSSDERALLEARKSSRTSLFEVIDVERKTARLHLRDLLDPALPDVMLMDLAMSSMPNAAGRILIFIRVLTCQGIQMTSGCFFTFAAEHRKTLLAAYANRMRSVPASERVQRTFVFFFQCHRKIGQPQEFANP